MKITDDIQTGLINSLKPRQNGHRRHCLTMFFIWNVNLLNIASWSDCGSVKWQSIGIILNLYDLVPIRRYPIINTNDDYVYYVCWCIYAYDLPPAFNEITYWSLICPLEDIQESFKNPLSVLLSINLVENINTHHYDINTNRWIREKILKQYKI